MNVKGSFVQLSSAKLLFWCNVTALILLFSVAAGSCFQQKKIQISTVPYLISTKWQTD